MPGNRLLFSLNAQMWSVELPLVTFGTPAQQRAYLPGMVSGELIAAHGMTEPESGSDALHLRTRAVRHGIATSSTGPSSTSPTPRSPTYC